jgi:hypothetical protein
MSIRARSTISAFLLALCGAAAGWSQETLEVACGFSGTGVDIVGGGSVNRGFYVTGYAGHTLGRVQLAYSADNAGTFLISLTARRGTYNGPQLGETQSVTIDIPSVASGTEAIVIYDFGGVPITPGDTITFSHAAAGPIGAGRLFVDTGSGPDCPGVFETNGTAPPLSSFRRHTMGVLISSFESSSVCVPSDTVLCVDDTAGDRRFQVTVSFHTGSLSGDGQEIPLAPLGVIHGGLFWFFGPDNPEMLFKMVNGCVLNSHFWIFISAGTNVGFTVHVFDTVTGHTRTYHNPDDTAAVPIQDTSALTCT